MTNRECEHFREQIGDYVCGGLVDSEIDSMNEHLADCADCQQELESYREVLATVDRAGLASAPTGLAGEVTDSVLARLEGAGRRPLLRFRPRAIASVAACLLAGLLGVFFLRPGNAEHDLEEQVAAVTANAESVLWLVHEIERENEAFLALLSHGVRRASDAESGEARDNKESTSQ